LLPSQFPKVPSVRDIAIPPQIKMHKLGCVQKIMSDPVPLVIIESLAEVKPLNDESMVFDIDRKPIGLIFETFGPVKQPFYSIRFNNMEEIDQAGLKEEKPIYFAEGFADYIPTTKLLLEKGSDASWENDKEVDAVHMDYSDDEEEKNAKSKLKEKRKVDPAIEAERAEKRRLKEEKIQESTVYICGLPPDFRERDIKELFQAFGPKKINLLKWPDGQSKSSGFVTLASKEKAQESIDRLNMKITLEGSLMPLAVKFSGGSRKRSRTDFDAPANDSYSNNSYIVTFESKKKETNSGYKVKERSQSASHTLHTLLPDEDDTPGCKHAFTKAIFVPGQGYIGPPSTMTEKKPIGQTGSTVKSPTGDGDVFNWGSDSVSAEVGTISTSSRFSSRCMPPELANPNQHPSPFEDKRDKTKKFITTTSINIDAVPKKQEIKIEPGESDSSPAKIAKIEYQTENIVAPVIKTEIKTEPLVAYGDDSDSGDDSDPENPSCMAFCSEKDKKVRAVPQPKRTSSSSEPQTPSDARRDSKVLNSLFRKAINND